MEAGGGSSTSSCHKKNMIMNEYHDFQWEEELVLLISLEKS